LVIPSPLVSKKLVSEKVLDVLASRFETALELIEDLDERI